MNHIPRDSAPPLLDIDNLRISFQTAHGRTEAVRGISLRMGRERVAVVGESGSRRSITFRSLFGLLPPTASVRADRSFIGAACRQNCADCCQPPSSTARR